MNLVLALYVLHTIVMYVGYYLLSPLSKIQHFNAMQAFGLDLIDI